MNENGARCQTSVLFELWRLSRSASALLAAPLADAGMSGDEFGIYSVLAAEDHLSPTALASWMSAPATTISSHLKRLEARGHIVRRVDPSDRRSYLVELSSTGIEAFERASAVYLPTLVRVEGNLSSQEPVVRRALITLRAAIDASSREHDPA